MAITDNLIPEDKLLVSNELYNLSKEINRMILEYEVTHNTKIAVSYQAGMFHPELYPNEPRIQLIEVI